VNRLIIVLTIVGIICWCWVASFADARDLGQWSNVDPAIATWYRQLQQPDTNISCCGESDAYEADEAHVINGKIIAVITDTRDDKTLRRAHVPIGTRFVVPPNKITRVDGNPTGHIIIFLGAVIWNGGTLGAVIGSADPATRPVLCYVMNGGT